MAPYKNPHIKITLNLLKQFLAFFLFLVLIKSTILFADPEVTDKSDNTFSEVIEKPLENRNTQKNLTAEIGELVEEEADTENKKKVDVDDEVVSSEIIEESKEISEAKETVEKLTSKFKERDKKKADIEREKKADVVEEVISSEEIEEPEDTLEANKAQEESASEAEERSRVEAVTEEKEKADVVGEVISSEEMKEPEESLEAEKTQGELASEAEKMAREGAGIGEKEKLDVAEETISSEEMEEPEESHEAKKGQEELISEVGEKVKEETGTEGEEKADLEEEVISSEEMKELKELHEARKTLKKLTSEAEEKAREEAVTERKEKPAAVEESVSTGEIIESEGPLDAEKSQEELASEVEEMAREEAEIEGKEKADEVGDIISTEEIVEQEGLASEAEERAREETEIERKEKPNVVEEPVSSEESIEQEELASAAEERIREETEIEEKEKPDVIDKVIKKVVIDKQEVPEVVKSAIKKAIVEDKELSDEVESAIKSKLDEEKKEATPLSSSSENVVKQLNNISKVRDKAIIKSFLSGRRPLMHAWNILTTKLNTKLGVNLGLAYTSLYQYAPDADGTKEAASGDLDIFGTWNLWNKESDHPGSIGFHTEYRHRYTHITPAELSENVGSLWRTIRGFNKKDFSLVEIWWEQQIYKEFFGFRVGKLNMKDYFNNYKFNSSNNYFFNTAFTDSPAIAFPENGGGLVLASKPSKKFHIVAGIADANGEKTSLDNTFFFTSSRYFYAIEFGIKHNFENLGKGSYSLTVWHREERDKGNLPSDEGFAISLEQELTEKITPFVRYSCSDGDATEIQQLLSAGVGFVDVFGREKDFAGIGLAWGAPADKSLHDQYTMDTFYRFRVMDHIHVTPGFQLLINPSNNPDSDVDGIFAIRARITF